MCFWGSSWVVIVYFTTIVLLCITLYFMTHVIVLLMHSSQKHLRSACVYFWLIVLSARVHVTSRMLLILILVLIAVLQVWYILLDTAPGRTALQEDHYITTL